MGKRKFIIELRGKAIIELDDRVIGQVDDEWRSQFYDIHTANDIAEMVGRCMILYGANLSSLDGFADLPDNLARIIEPADWEGGAIEKLPKREDA